MHFAARSLALSTLVAGTVSSPIEKRASCPGIHVFGARETTAPAGYGSSGTFVNQILSAYPGSTDEAVVYPAQGGTNDAYAASVRAGTQSIASAINSFNSQCPNTKIVLVGYSQGAQITDNAFCGGGDTGQGITSTSPLLTAAASKQIKAVIWAGNPRHSPGEPFNYGTCAANGFDPRPQGFSCSPYASIIRSYCDSADPYCCNGTDANVHQGYGAEYGSNALAFVKSKLG